MPAWQAARRFHSSLAEIRLVPKTGLGRRLVATSLCSTSGSFASFRSRLVSEPDYDRHEPDGHGPLRD